jgi:hypothetical protein
MVFDVKLEANGVSVDTATEMKSEIGFAYYEIL